MAFNSLDSVWRILEEKGIRLWWWGKFVLAKKTKLVYNFSMNKFIVQTSIQIGGISILLDSLAIRKVANSGE